VVTMMKATDLSGHLRWLDPVPIFFALIGKILDLFTTFVALKNPLNYEANPLGIHIIPYIILILVVAIIPQLAGLKWQNLRSLGLMGSYMVAISTFIPVVNNLVVLQGV